MMGKKEFEYCYNSFLQGVYDTRNVSYGSRKDVQRNNRGIEKYRDAAKCIGKYYPEKITEFAALLDDGNKDIRVACAVSVLTLMNADALSKEKALSIIRHIAANGTPLEKISWSTWLKKEGYCSTGDASPERPVK